MAGYHSSLLKKNQKLNNTLYHFSDIKSENETRILTLKLIRLLTLALKRADIQSEPDFYICV